MFRKVGMVVMVVVMFMMFGLLATTTFANPRTSYPIEYRVKSIAEQVNRLQELFPELSNANANEKLAERPLPAGVEGWFAIPRWEKIGRTYEEAVERVLAKISETRDGQFYSFCEGELGSQYLRQHERTVEMFQKLGDQQKDYNILVVPAQFGFRYRGRSVEQAREAFAPNEFGLGVFAVGCMLLIHPERLVQWEQLHVDCAGDEYAPKADGRFRCAPSFSFNGPPLEVLQRGWNGPPGRVFFGAGWLDSIHEDYGAATAFVPR